MKKNTTLVTEKNTGGTTNKKAGIALLVICLLVGSIFNSSAQQENVGFTQADRDRIIRMEVILEQHLSLIHI